MALQSGYNRWEWGRMEAERKRLNEREADEEKLAFQSIDWFDFTVVETIDFAMDELLDGGGASTGSGGNSNPIPVAPTLPPRPPPYNGVPLPQPVPLSVIPIAPPIPTPKPQVLVVSQDMDMDEDMDMDVEDTEEDVEDSDIKVVSNYIPRTAQTMSSSIANKFMVDPISGKQIPAGGCEGNKIIYSSH